MDESIKIRLERLRKKIEKGDYDIRYVREWGGADVIISDKLTPDIKRWLGNAPKVISLQKMNLENASS